MCSLCVFVCRRAWRACDRQHHRGSVAANLGARNRPAVHWIREDVSGGNRHAERRAYRALFGMQPLQLSSRVKKASSSGGNGSPDS